MDPYLCCCCDLVASHGEPPSALSSFLTSLNITDASEALGSLGRERELYPDLGFRHTSDTGGRGERDGSWTSGDDKGVLGAKDSLVAVVVLTLSLANPPPAPLLPAPGPRLCVQKDRAQLFSAV